MWQHQLTPRHFLQQNMRCVGAADRAATASVAVFQAPQCQLTLLRFEPGVTNVEGRARFEKVVCAHMQREGIILLFEMRVTHDRTD